MSFSHWINILSMDLNKDAVIFVPYWFATYLYVNIVHMNYI